MPPEIAPTLEKPIDTPPVETPEVDPNAKHELLPELMKSLLADVPDEEKKPEKAESEDGSVPEKPIEKKEAAPVTKADPPITVRRKPAEKRPDLPLTPAVQAPTPARAEPPVVATPAPVNDSDLEENEKEMIADAAYMEKKWPEKYKGYEAKTRKYVRDHIDFIGKHGGDDFDENSQEYQQFLSQNRPRLSQSEIREINETRIADRAAEGPMKELQRMKQDRFNDREEPSIRQDGVNVYNRLAHAVTPKEITEELKTRPYAEVYAENKVELDTVHEVLSAMTEDVKEFNRITKVNPETGLSMVPVANDPRDPKYAQHQRLAAIVRETCEQFKNNGGANLKRDGKWFVTKDEWFQIRSTRPDLIGNYWTFTNKEIIERALKNVPKAVAGAIEANRKYFADRGYVRKPKPAPAAAANQKTPVRGSPPAAHPSSIPSGDGTGGGTASVGSKLASVLGRDEG